MFARHRTAHTYKTQTEYPRKMWKVNNNGRRWQKTEEDGKKNNQRKLGSNLPSYGHIELCDFTQWRVVCDFTSHHNEKCETTFNEGWCVTLHHITMRSVRLYSMKGGKTHCHGCMDVTWAFFWGKAGAGNLVFFRVKWLRPAMKGTSCVRRVRLGSNQARLVPPLCSAMSGCSRVRSSMRFLTLWLQIAV